MYQLEPPLLQEAEDDSKNGGGEIEMKHEEEDSPHCTKHPIYAFQEMKLRGLVPNSYIHVSVSDLYM